MTMRQSVECRVAYTGNVIADGIDVVATHALTSPSNGKQVRAICNRRNAIGGAAGACGGSVESIKATARPPTPTSKAVGEPTDPDISTSSDRRCKA